MGKKSRRRPEAQAQLDKIRRIPPPSVWRRRIQQVFLFTKSRGIEIILAFSLGLASTATWEFFFKDKSDGMRLTREQMLSVRGELTQYATVSFFLQKHPNFHNNPKALPRFGLMIPPSSYPTCRDKIHSLLICTAKTMGSASNATKSVKNIERVFLEKGSQSFAYGSPNFISDVYSAKTLTDDREISKNYEKYDAEFKNKSVPVVFAPGGTTLDIKSTIIIFDELDAAIGEVDKRLGISVAKPR